MVSADAMQWVSVGVALVAAGVVAWQSVETRRSARAAQEAARTAAEGLTVATNALEVAQDEERHTREIIIETHRTRMDAAVPAIGATPNRHIAWPLKMGIGDQAPWQFEEIPTDQQFALPRDGGIVLAVQGQVTLWNASNQVVELRAYYAHIHSHERTEERVRLEAGESRDFPFLMCGPVRGWAAGEQELINSVPYVAPFFANYSDSRDSGVGIGWEFWLDGPILEPVSNLAETYVLSQKPPELFLRRENRTYWLSRRRQAALPEPDGQPA